jgi:histone-lysine N-methyltransferase SETMAR
MKREKCIKNTEIHLILLYEFKLGHRSAEECQNINLTLGKGTTCTRTVQRWFDRFRSGDTSLEEKHGRGRAPAVDNQQLKTLVEANPRTTARELALELGVGCATIMRHLTAIGQKKKLDKWVPHDLTENQKNRRLEVASSLLLRQKNEPFLDRIITCYEKWILYDNTRRSGQWLDYDEQPDHCPKPDLHPKKVMVTVWWTACGIIHDSFLESGKSITAESYS